MRWRLLAAICWVAPLVYAQEIPPYSISLEAECGEVGSNFTETSTDSASGRAALVGVDTVSFLTDPPLGASENTIRFVVDIPFRTNYRMYGRTSAPNGDSDSFWVRINGGPWFEWNEGIGFDRGFTWDEVAGSPFNLFQGKNSIEFAVREQGTQLDKILITTERKAPTGLGPRGTNCDPAERPVDCEQYPMACDTTVYAEAECGAYGTNWFREEDDAASNGNWTAFRGEPRLATPPNTANFQDQLIFDADLNGEGEYSLFFRLDVPDQGRNSFWVKVDDGDWLLFDRDGEGNQLATEGFEWFAVTNEGLPATFNLNPGPHRITIGGRERGARLDKIYFGLNAELPEDAGPAAVNCTADDLIDSRRPGIDLTARLHVFPNPIHTDRLNFTLRNPATGSLRVEVFDAAGRRLIERGYIKSGREFTGRLEVDRLPAGMYRLVLTTESGLVTRSFVKH